MLHTVNHSGIALSSTATGPETDCPSGVTGYVSGRGHGDGADWRIQPPSLKDECVPPSFGKADQSGEDADVVGTGIVNNLNVDLPSMRVGHNRFRVGRTLSETLGNEACYEAFWTAKRDLLPDGWPDEPWVDFSFVRVNVQGVWFAVGCIPQTGGAPSETGDAPGWWAEWRQSLPDCG